MKQIIDKIRNIDIDNVTEKDIEDILPFLGLNDEKLEQMPSHLNAFFGTGLKSWQYPIQFSKYLKKITTLNIGSYLEIGSRWGGTFIITTEFLKLKNKNIKSYACDIIEVPSLLKEYKQYENFTYLHKSSFDLNKNDIDVVDLILIDGGHWYETVKKDYETSLSFSPKYIVFHDIYSDACPGVVQIWNEVKNNFIHYEYIDQYDEVIGKFLGIGIIEIK